MSNSNLHYHLTPRTYEAKKEAPKSDILRCALLNHICSKYFLSAEVSDAFGSYPSNNHKDGPPEHMCINKDEMNVMQIIALGLKWTLNWHSGGKNHYMVVETFTSTDEGEAGTQRIIGLKLTIQSGWKTLSYPDDNECDLKDGTLSVSIAFSFPPNLAVSKSLQMRSKEAIFDLIREAIKDGFKKDGQQACTYLNTSVGEVKIHTSSGQEPVYS